jgi:hypothetical protein
MFISSVKVQDWQEFPDPRIIQDKIAEEWDSASVSHRHATLSSAYSDLSKHPDSEAPSQENRGGQAGESLRWTSGTRLIGRYQTRPA